MPMRNGLPAGSDTETGGGVGAGAGAGADSCFLQAVAIMQRHSMPRHVSSHAESLPEVIFIDGVTLLSE